MLSPPANDMVQGELLQFCIGSLAQEQERAATEAERREARARTKTYRDLLLEEMRRSQTAAVRLPGSDGVCAMMVPKTKAPRKLCAASVSELLGALDEMELRAFGAGGGLIEAVSHFLRDKLRPRETGEYSLRIKRASERTPAAAATTTSSEVVTRVGADLLRCIDEDRQKRNKLKEKLSVHEERCRKAEPLVKTYIQRMGPDATVAPLEIDVRGSKQKFFVRRRERTVLKPLSLKALLELTAHELRTFCAEEGLDESVVSERAVLALRQPAVRERLFARLEERIARFRRQGGRTLDRVTLERGRGAAQPK